MTGAAAVPALTITGYAALSRVGDGPAPLPAAAGVPVPRGDAATAALYPQQLPAGHATAFAGFDVRGYLGRKGTSFYDRATALAVVACGQALRDAAVLVDEDTRGRVGVVLGTTLGSFKSTSDYSRETLVQERPYLVNPVLFPNTVMNCAAGQAAIRLGLRGINATITGGPLAFLNAVRYAVNAIGQGYVDTMLVGAVEEFTPHRAWAAHLLGGGTAAAPAGEGAAAFVVRAAGSTEDNGQSTVDGLGGTGSLAEILEILMLGFGM